jgi:prevent-host-death family protein
MKTATVSIAEGKRDFSRLIKDMAESKSDVVVTKRGAPVAVIVPYDEYMRSHKIEAQQKILESRALFARAKISADGVYRESRRKLEGRR